MLLNAVDKETTYEPLTGPNSPEDVSYAVRQVLHDAMDAAVENWAEGYWPEFTTKTTHGDVLDQFVGFIQAWKESVDIEEDPAFATLLLPEQPDGDEDLPV